VLTVYLQRVQFVRQSGEAVKVHGRFEFPFFLHMDRFLAKNRVAASRARSEVVNLRQRLATCSSELLKIYDFVDREKILLEKSPSETDWIDSAYARVLRRLEVASPPQGFDRNAMEQASHLLREMQKAEASEVLALQVGIMSVN